MNPAQAAGFAHHFLSQSEPLAGVFRCGGSDEQIRRRQSEFCPHLVGQSTTDHQRDAATGPHLIADGAGIELKTAHNRAFPFDRSVVGTDGDHIAGVQDRDIALDRQRAGVFRGVEKDRSDLAAEDHTAGPFVGNEGDVITGVPEHGVDRAFAGAARSHHIAHIGHGMPVLLQGLNGFEALWIAGLQHGQGMQGDVRPGRGVGGGREVVGVGFTLDFEHRHGDALSEFRLGGEPLGCSPAVDHLLGERVAVRQLHHFIEGVINEQDAAEAVGGAGRQFGIAVFQQLDQSGHVVTAHHRSQQLGGVQRRHQWAADIALGHCAEPGGFDVGRFVHTRRDAFTQKMQQGVVFPAWRVLQQFGQPLRLLSSQSQSRNALGFPFSGQLAVSAQHGMSVRGFTPFFRTASVAYGQGA